MFKRSLMLWMVAAGLAAVCMMVGCEAPWDDDDDSPAGTSTVQGNIKSFDYQGGAVVSAAVKAGVTVYLKGTKFSATTADDGTFVISGVPAGNYELVIKYGDSEVVYPLNVPDNARVEITDVVVGADGVISMASLRIVYLGSTSSADDDDDGSAGGASLTIKIGRE